MTWTAGTIAGVGVAGAVVLGIGAYAVHRVQENRERDDREAERIATQKTLPELPDASRPTAEVAALLIRDFDQQSAQWRADGDGAIGRNDGERLRLEYPVGEGERYTHKEENFMGFHDRSPAVRYEQGIVYDGSKLWETVEAFTEQRTSEESYSLGVDETSKWLRARYDSDGRPSEMSAAEQDALFADYPEAFTEPTRVDGPFKHLGEFTRW